ncbi:MAG: mitochondrial import inner membrane translocase subunit tim54 [Piccolia ochrophora]|nr:MAG: mitochondrial import inner membrane translocase subunit tim54 [Piccolia ochrophora]
MTESNPPVANGASHGASPPPKRNPAFRMLGIPNFTFKLPSRNWLIFLSVTGSFASLILYDKYEKKKSQKKWCTLVSHLAREPLDSRVMPRKVTVFLAAPPGDGLRVPREHFIEYIKPILVAAAMDWDVIEGRREGDLRAGLAERIRKLRKRSEHPNPAEEEEEDVVRTIRERGGIRDWDGTMGDIVVGRHTWKEYIRGLHEGWLGPLKPPEVDSIRPSDATQDPFDPDAQSLLEGSASPEASPAGSEPEKPTQETKKPSESAAIPAFIPTSAYPQSNLPQSLPQSFDPVTPFPLQHVLGFLNTPTRIYRFLNRRHLAENAGRETAAVVLAMQTRPYHSSTSSSNDPDFATNFREDPSPGVVVWEQEAVLEHEESDWHKSVRKARANDTERTWLDDVVMDPRIAERMLRFELSSEDDARAGRISQGLEIARDAGQKGDNDSA